MTPDISEKYIKVSDGHFVTAKHMGEVQIKIRDYNGIPFVDTLYNIQFAPDVFN